MVVNGEGSGDPKSDGLTTPGGTPLQAGGGRGRGQPNGDPGGGAGGRAAAATPPGRELAESGNFSRPPHNPPTRKREYLLRLKTLHKGRIGSCARSNRHKLCQLELREFFSACARSNH